jgi:hypothetical protein
MLEKIVKILTVYIKNNYILSTSKKLLHFHLSFVVLSVKHKKNTRRYFMADDKDYKETLRTCSPKIEQTYVCDVKRGTEAERLYLKANEEFREVFASKVKKDDNS